MAKNEKLVDLKPEKVTPSQLEKIQTIVSNINKSQMEIGRLETSKHMISHQVIKFQDELRKMQDERQEVYGGHTICDIIEEDDKFSIYIRKDKDVLPWKDFNKNMAVSVEYNLEY